MREIGKILILTVGTGTAGRESNVAEGLMAAVRQNAPDFSVLLPSEDDKSIAVADIVAEGTADVCSFRRTALSNPDSLGTCRNEIKKCLVSLADEFPKGKLTLNPTSGTKQMTAAATLAALECGIESIEFISGPRQDGVVVTGKEIIETANLRAIRAQEALRLGLGLSRAGANAAAAKIIEPYADLFPVSFHLANALSWWDRFGYSRAKSELDSIKSESTDLTRCRKALSGLGASPAISTAHVADMLNFAARCLARSQIEEALGAIYRASEAIGRLLLARDGSTSKNSGPSIGEIYQEMGKVRHPSAFFDTISNPQVWKIMQFRQQTRYGHGVEFADPGKIQTLLDAITVAATKDFPDFSELLKLTAHPDLDTLTMKELTNA